MNGRAEWGAEAFCNGVSILLYQKYVPHCPYKGAKLTSSPMQDVEMKTQWPHLTPQEVALMPQQRQKSGFKWSKTLLPLHRFAQSSAEGKEFKDFLEPIVPPKSCPLIWILALRHTAPGIQFWVQAGQETRPPLI